VFRYRCRCRRLPDYADRDEHRIEVPGRPRGVTGHRQGGTSDQEELGFGPACSQFRG
jgi:hypothetical protein